MKDAIKTKIILFLGIIMWNSTSLLASRYFGRKFLLPEPFQFLGLGGHGEGSKVGKGGEFFKTLVQMIEVDREKISSILFFSPKNTSITN